MLTLMLLACAVDTIIPPQPVSAITVSESDNLVCLADTQDEVIIFDKDEWYHRSLPEFQGLVTRFMVNSDLCYFLVERRLVLIDLARNRKSTISEDIDDAVINSYGELKVLSGYHLKKLTPLGRILDEETLTEIQGWMWPVDDSVIFSAHPPLPAWFIPPESSNTSESPSSNLFELAESAPRSGIAATRNSIYILLEHSKILHLYE
ncbi:hypothetical protein GF359_05845 [candidate division WOR-3 bacterium]|uniref:Uncharacterized protein n=1 Tax=candidate division WOR-3 bacterium TaxID=2052148 RepID=A0A9D5KAT7_UNCW3|nr:hypothetical protein [candidate division WOR-3 bacterium]MBD3364720.1 hypothetical protein [candidate division WOR-3 bacterium]